MNNYGIVVNEDKLRSFIEWLPELKPLEKYYVSLLARRKYLPDAVGMPDKLSLKRFISDKTRLFNKIKQLEIETGSYRYGKEDLAVPEETLALYITPNPRDLVKAAKRTITELQQKTWAEYDGYDPVATALSSVQTSNGTVTYFDFDFDFDGVSIDNTIEELKRVINLDACTFIETYGGFHLLVNISKVADSFKKSWNPRITKLAGCDVRGTSNMIPVPGCIQATGSPTLTFLTNNGGRK